MNPYGTFVSKVDAAQGLDLVATAVEQALAAARSVGRVPGASPLVEQFWLWLAPCMAHTGDLKHIAPSKTKEHNTRRALKDSSAAATALRPVAVPVALACALVQGHARGHVRLHVGPTHCIALQVHACQAEPGLQAGTRASSVKAGHLESFSAQELHIPCLPLVSCLASHACLLGLLGS